LVSPDTERVTIGRPIANTQAYLLDEQQQPVAEGELGELYLGGAGVARGYLHRPELTAARFIRNPFANNSSDRLYRTGDLARRLSDGNLEYLGRIDHQVKIRGFRIELGEIEAALWEHPHVQQAVAVATEEQWGNKRLVAYVVPQPTAANAERTSSLSDRLRRFLRTKLPPYMVPSYFAVLEAMPLTPNGKIDRKALPAPDIARPHLENEFVPPSTPTETTLAGIWEDILGIDSVGVRDNFLDLGGHSLLATQIVSRIGDTWGLDLPLRFFFESPTIRDIANYIDGSSEAFSQRSEATSGPNIPTVSRDQSLPLSFAQERLWFLDRLIPGHPFYNVTEVVRLQGELDRNALKASLAEIVKRHESLRTTFDDLEGQPIQVVGSADFWHFSVVDVRELSESERETAARDRAIKQAQQSFDLNRGPLMEVTLIQMGERDHFLVLNLHHILCDDWSLSVIFHELSLLYPAFAAGQPSPLPELPFQYADFAVWQRQWLQGEVLEEQRRYWREKLTDVPVLQLPTDRPRPPIPSYWGDRQYFTLPPSLSEALQSMSRHEGVTPFMTLLAAFQILLYRYTEQEDILVGSPIANRHRRDLEQAIGFFVNTLVLRTDLSGVPSFREVLARVREVTLSAYAYQDLPLEKLVNELHPERDLSSQPLFQVVFALQNELPLEDLDLPGLQKTPVEVYNQTAKFDLLLQLFVTEEGIRGWFEYSTDLFDADTIARMVEHWQTLLEGIVANPERPISELPILTQAERQQLLVSWNQTQADYPQDACMHHLVEQQVARSPHAIATLLDEEFKTYSEIDGYANQLARHLQSLGVGPEVPVGIYLDRSTDIVVAPLAVLKAGGTYVPLDPKWPGDRIQWILSSLNIQHVVTHSSRLKSLYDLQGKFPDRTSIVCLDVTAAEVPVETLEMDTVTALWDSVANRAVDRVTAGGFISSYTGQPFSEAEVDEYRDYICNLLSPYLGSQKRVLEIGCGSGILGFAIAEQVAFYVGIDPSPVTQERNRQYAAEQQLDNVRFATGFAHELEGLPENGFDSIVIASTIQFFPGPMYLQQVIQQALDKLAPGGTIAIADIPDPRQKDAFKQSLEEFRWQNPEAASHQQNQSDTALYVDWDFFYKLQNTCPQLASVQAIPREQGFNNELRYRYDLILTKHSDSSQQDTRSRTNPQISTAWDLRQQSPNTPTSQATADSTAYIIHTSGSTGVPKGVVVPHRSAVNLIDWVNKTFQVSNRDRILFVTSLTFDLSVYDIFGLLAAGGSIRIASTSQLREPQQLVNLLLEDGITFWDSAPAALQQLVPFFPQQPAQGSNQQLRLVFLSGDWIPVTLPDTLRTTFDQAQVVALGGATEATIWSNFYPIDRVDPQWKSIPYGKPIQNAQYYILDQHLNPCPIGIPGELYIGGTCLAAGYTDPEKTAERFIPYPFNELADSRTDTTGKARLYKTGDLARYFPDGNIEFLGRIDHQVKIRGFRIELGEIEAVLCQHPAVQLAVVIDREDSQGQKQLVAYVVPEGEGNQNLSTQLRKFLHEKLPEYMVPAAVVLLECLPVTANGKLDRKALPEPQPAHLASQRSTKAPQTSEEQQMVSVWSQVLGIHAIGMEDNFFELGGNSLLAAQLVAHIKDTYQTEIPLRCVFEQPTPQGLVEAVTVAHREGVSALNPAIDLQAEVDAARQGLEAGFPHHLAHHSLPMQPFDRPHKIFLTGATGFLGAFLLEELVRQTQAKVYCLVRAASTQEGMRKIENTLVKYGIPVEELQSRVVPVLGDLDKPYLGLSWSHFQHLGEQIDAIYHSGAQVNFAKPYSKVKAANVGSTQEVIKLASCGALKPLHFMSTVGAFGPISHFRHIGCLQESDSVDLGEESIRCDMGYGQSKWVAEKLIQMAQAKGVPATVFRLGFLLCHSQTGAANTKDYMSRLIRGCIQIGSFPDLVDQKEEVIPVDYASQAIAHLSRKPASIGKVFHIVPANVPNLSLDELFGLVARGGYPLQKVPYEQWKAALLRETKRFPDHALSPLVPLFAEKVYGDLTLMQLYQHTPDFDCTNTLQGLQDTSIVCPPITSGLVDAYLSFLSRVGVLEDQLSVC
jgi:amino acid adenylation domain-containing protein/thioester reductase-like protein